MSLLITRPRYDNATHYLFYWSEKLTAAATEKGLRIFDLQKKKANRKTVESYLYKQSPSTVIFNGHGDDHSITGQDDEILISANENDHLLKGKDVFMRACDAGNILGPNSIKKGANGFIGYKEKFVFFMDREKFRKPLQDEWAKPFLECSNQVGISLIKGHPAREAHDRSIKIYAKIIENMLTSKSTNTFLLPYLLWNMKNQVCYEGDQ